MLVKVIAINVLVFLLINICWVILSMAGRDDLAMRAGSFVGTWWLSAPASPTQLILKPWSIITYMFTQQDIWHLVFNMLMLYFSGRIFCDMLNDRRFLPLYIIGGLAGLVFFVIGYNIFPKLYPVSELAYIHGASASVMAVFIATAVYFPAYEVYLFGIIRMKLVWLAVIYVAIDFVALRGMSNIGGHLSHLGGAAYGYFFAIQLKNGKDHSEFLGKLFDSIGSIFEPKPKIKVVHRDQNAKGRNTAPSKSDQQKVVDEILDKINRSGYESLTKAEKEILLKASKD